ncbi:MULTISPECIES: glycosyltransferase family 39 protein [unclassified Nocardia]|uniref:glycosyltransferase family 39 protein n=1 Tax=unclassified Nocardia TaxID=2637762 RepID=UPI0024A94F8D|nr:MULTISPECIES: glycosyltransferase family 39 protein [unclassified Nocardia]
MYWVAGVFAAVLGVFADRYGYHRDEMYFLAAGRRLDWGYADQPPLTPLIARGVSAVDADSLVLLRLPAIAAATVVVICAGLAARELGGGKAAQTVASASVAAAALVMAAGHLFGTTIIDLAVWSGVVVLLLRLLRSEADPRLWLAVGALAGVGLLNKALIAVPLVVTAVCFAAIGPRKIFATRYFPLAVLIAVLLVSPYLLWQARHGWPQWEVSRSLAGGSSGTSDTPLTFVLLQLGLIGPLLVPLWAFGLWWLWRSPYRAFVLTYGALFALYAIVGGKAYYLGGMYPLLLAAGAVGLERWYTARRVRAVGIGAVVGVGAVGSALLFLPVLPVSAIPESPVPEVNYDAGETIGWPEFVRQIAEIRSEVAPDAELLTSNYGEAAALERFGAAYGLPTPHSGHNAYWWWGPPADGRWVFTVGIQRVEVERLCHEPESMGRIDNGFGVDNDEQGAELFLCRDPRRLWGDIWSMMRHLG